MNGALYVIYPTVHCTCCFSYFSSEGSLPFPIFSTVDAASLLGEVSHLVPDLLSKQDVICLDSSGDEEEKVDPKLPTLGLRDGKIILK